MHQVSYLYSGLAAAFWLSGATGAQAGSSETLAQAHCHVLAAGLSGMTIEQAIFQSEEPAKSGTPGKTGSLPAHCEVTGILNPHTGLDGQSYAIRFHLRLPLQWNNRFYFQGGGGTDGDIGDAIGRMGSTSALEQGYAVVSQDAGHDNSRNTRPDHNGASAFGFDPRARLDYGRASLKATADAARRIIVTYYGLKPRYAYFVGCSKGGQEGMALAQYYPDEFDGIIAAAPGFALPRAAVAEAWDTRSFGAVVTQVGQAFNAMALFRSYSSSDMQLVRQAILKACDADDGLEDGLVSDFRACTSAKVVPQLKAVVCAGDKTDACLSTVQIAALVRSHDGAKDGKGHSLYSDWPWSAGVSAEDWRIWKIGSSDGRVPPLNIILGGGALSGIFTTPPTPLPADPMSLGAYMWSFDFDRDASRIYASGGDFQTSAWSDISARSADLSAFRRRGGKMIVPQGTSDPVFSIDDTLAWYEDVEDHNSGHADAFVRVFPVPDMGHCSGGVSTDQYDAFTSLTTWVEHGKAPDEIIATAGPATPWPNRKRPLCPYPKVARYTGGSPEEASSFRCEI